MMKRLTLVIVALLTAFGASAENEVCLKTVVLDAGHGGYDPGAVSFNGKYQEKNFVLDITKRLKKLINKKYPDVNVVLTRSDDTFIPLDERGNISNKAGADLFISIHVNASSSPKPSGFSTHVLGQSSNKNKDLYKENLELVKRENSIITLDGEHKPVKKEFDPKEPGANIFMAMMQSAILEQSIDFAQIINKNLTGGPFKVNRGVSQDPFRVLWKTTCPAVLVELGFITNANDLAKLSTESGRQELAERLLKAFGEYKRRYDEVGTHSTGAKPAVSETSQVSSSDKPSGTKPAQKPQVRYGVQIFAVSADIKAGDSRLLGYKPSVYPSGKVKRYVVGECTSLEEVKKVHKRVKAEYPDCFIVRIDGEKVSRAN